MQLKVPVKREEITSDWLNTIFKPHGIAVHSFTFTGDASNGRGYMGTLAQAELQISRHLNHKDDKKPSDCIETLYIILKTLPKDIFLNHLEPRSRVFSSREISMYTEVFPIWQKFLDSRQVPLTNRFRQPICYYGAEEGEGDSYRYILVLENLTAPSLVPTFHLWTGGFNKPLPWLQTSAIIRQIARFHATGIAFQVETQVDYNQRFPKLVPVGSSGPPFEEMWETAFETAKKVIHETMKKEEIPDGILEQLDILKGDGNRDLLLRLSSDPTGIPEVQTVCHGDLHSNNLVLSEDNTMAILFDYQICRTINPMKDLSFFLILNCHSEDSINNLSRALQLYHDEFAATMAAIKIDFKYSLEEMQRDYNKYLVISIIHIMRGQQVWLTGPGTTLETKRNFSNVLVDAYRRGLLEIP